MTTGEKIRQLRKQLGLTQEELGQRIGVGKAAINKYEVGTVVNLKKSTIYSLSEALGVSPVVLLDAETTSFSPDEQRLMELYRTAEPSAREYAVEMLENHQKKDTEQSVI